MSLLSRSSFPEHFASLTDPRHPHAPKQRHQLCDILVIAICAVVSGAEGWEDIEEYGKAQADWFAELLDWPNGIPGHDTFRRVLSRLDPEELTRCFISWTEALREHSGGDIVAIDGKTLRHSFDQANAQAAIHLVSVWASANRLVLAQVKVAGKSNEITAIPRLLQLLDLAGATVTIDAMGCQKKIVRAIARQEADYVLGLKKNHRGLYADVKLFFDEARATDFALDQYGYQETVEGAHGRVETRRYWTTEDIGWLEGRSGWANLRSIGMVESRRAVGNNDTAEPERRYFLSSLPGDGARFAVAVRQHWGIENSLHWVLDVSFAAADSRIRKDQGAEIFATLRHIALNLLRRENSHKRGIKARRKRAGWDRAYLLQVLTA